MTLTLASSTSTTALPEAWVERLFERMLLDYGRKFADQWEKADMDKLIAHWAVELAGYSGTELKRGLDALSTRDWPPTLPEFKKLCRRPLDPMHAYYEAVAGVQARALSEYGKWSHPAIYWAAMPMAFDLGSQTFSQIRPRWEAALQEQMDRGEWPEIPQPMVALPAPGKSRTSREEASQRLRALGASGIVKDHRGGDMRGWARRILEREAAGDTTVLRIQVEFAHQALSAGAA
jgi:hypothetical protein